MGGAGNLAGPTNPAFAWLPACCAPLEPELARLRAAARAREEDGLSAEVRACLAALLRGLPPAELALLAQLRAWVCSHVLLLDGLLLNPLDASVTPDHLKQWIKMFYPGHNLANTQRKETLLSTIGSLLAADASEAAFRSKGESLLRRIHQLKEQAEAYVGQQRALAAWQQAGAMAFVPLSGML